MGVRAIAPIVGADYSTVSRDVLRVATPEAIDPVTGEVPDRGPAQDHDWLANET